MRFELQCLSTAVAADMDTQGRLLPPERPKHKAKPEKDLILVGEEHRVDVWNRVECERSLGIDWASDERPDWAQYMRRRLV
jgi:DNA-binding transcriptional regulator/RsmH inhibitor MraZ